MAPTNQQLADLMSQIINSTDRHTSAFTTAVEKLIQNDNRHHDEFRSAIQELAKDQALADQLLAQHSENWGRVYKLMAAVVLVPIGLTVIQLIIK